MEEKLSKREREVWHLLAQGKTNKEIAWALKIAEGTVKTYIHRLYFKLGVSSRAEAARMFGEVVNHRVFEFSYKPVPK